MAPCQTYFLIVPDSVPPTSRAGPVGFTFAATSSLVCVMIFEVPKGDIAINRGCSRAVYEYDESKEDVKSE